MLISIINSKLLLKKFLNCINYFLLFFLMYHSSKVTYQLPPTSAVVLNCKTSDIIQKTSIDSHY